MSNEPRRPKLAIISSYTKFCGIAAYTRRLERYLADSFDIEVLELDQELLRKDTPRRMKLADKHIDEMCARLAEFDEVNIQWEPGTLGPNAKVSFRRLKKLVRASPNVSHTFHTFEPDESLPLGAMLRDALILKPKRAVGRARHWYRVRWIGSKPFALLKSESRRKRVSLIVHTKREARTLELDYGFTNVFHHPLSFLRDEDVAEAIASASRASFPQIAGIDPETKLIGIFGFIAPYKGTITAVRALRSLPRDYHLLVFGGIHPASIQQHQEIDGYLERVIGEVSQMDPRLGVRNPQHLDEEGHIIAGTEYADPASVTTDSAEAPLSQVIAQALTMLRPTPEDQIPADLADRVHFMGSLDDDGFVRGMSLCEAVVLPYLEVGQTSSGPVSLAVELQRRVLVSRNHAFAEYAKYHGDRVEFFDIGNHAELAERIRRPSPAPEGRPAVNYRTNEKTYRQAHGLPAEREAPAALVPSEIQPKGAPARV
ncbi:MAG: glycosyltransferase involved in cell wall biosynthesis [Phycisphaerales bacterium]|jgi:glycosyltransferase involved in cell wall biosynthesis